ncbi:MAG: CsgG/HfaB family protein [Holophagaceae bacterium]|nr:CsgG/HfaB family protein [Holophagaceae bacterium]
MKQSIGRLIGLNLALVAFAFVGITSPAQAQEKKERIGIVSFGNSSEYRDAGVSNGLMAELASMLSKNKKFLLIERAQLNAVIGETRLGMEGITDDTAAEMGKLASLDYVITGNINEIGVSVTDSSYSDRNGRHVSSYRKATNIGISIKMIDVSTGAVAFTETERASSSTSSSSRPSSNLDTGVAARLGREALSKIVMRMGIGTEATVVQVKGNMVMIDMGSNDGALKGQRYRIIQEGDPILHPTTGEVIAVDETVVAYITLETVSPTTSMGKISNVQTGTVTDARGRERKGKLEVVPGLIVRQIDSQDGRSLWEKAKDIAR